MKRKLLFVDRDGCLVIEPADEQLDSFGKFDLMPGVIAALQRCVGAGYELVMVTNQDGLGTPSFPDADFDGPQELLLRILASQGIHFSEVLVDRSFEHEQLDTRKPGIGMVRHFLADDGWSRDASAMVGDRETDLQFAANLGVRGFRVGPGGMSWSEVAHHLLDRPRLGAIERNTRETRVAVQVDLDRVGEPDIATGIGFFDHMLEQLGKHGGFSLPMDESCADARLDLSGRAYFLFDGHFPRDRVGGLPTELVPHFFRSLAEALGANLHLAVRGDNAHHMVEACFKVVARTLRQALRREGDALPSTKGVLA
jgi:imidazoleglycerol-phosphate dehydratase/histidinol-phosphatase